MTTLEKILIAIILILSGFVFQFMTSDCFWHGDDDGCYTGESYE